MPGVLDLRTSCFALGATSGRRSIKVFQFWLTKNWWAGCHGCFFSAFAWPELLALPDCFCRTLASFFKTFSTFTSFMSMWLRSVRQNSWIVHDPSAVAQKWRHFKLPLLLFTCLKSLAKQTGWTRACKMPVWFLCSSSLQNISESICQDWSWQHERRQSQQAIP